jgi:hypothetical protein
MNTMAKKPKIEELTDLLKDLEATTPDIEASAVVSVDGLMIASALPQDVEATLQKISKIHHKPNISVYDYSYTGSSSLNRTPQ